jgi:hypothetical protein
MADSFFLSFSMFFFEKKIYFIAWAAPIPGKSSFGSGINF